MPSYYNARTGEWQPTPWDGQLPPAPKPVRKLAQTLVPKSSGAYVQGAVQVYESRRRVPKALRSQPAKIGHIETDGQEEWWQDSRWGASGFSGRPRVGNGKNTHRWFRPGLPRDEEQE